MATSRRLVLVSELRTIRKNERGHLSTPRPRPPQPPQTSTQSASLHPDVATASAHRRGGVPLQSTHARARAHSQLRCERRVRGARVHLFDGCVVSALSGYIISCHLSEGHEGATCYLNNEWCSPENLPITTSVETVMRPTALLPWRR